jgi:hypothetical protein
LTKPADTTPVTHSDGSLLEIDGKEIRMRPGDRVIGTRSMWQLDPDEIWPEMTTWWPDVPPARAVI